LNIRDFERVLVVCVDMFDLDFTSGTGRDFYHFLHSDTVHYEKLHSGIVLYVKLPIVNALGEQNNQFIAESSDIFIGFVLDFALNGVGQTYGERLIFLVFHKSLCM
jgi:hypothetical protein